MDDRRPKGDSQDGGSTDKVFLRREGEGEGEKDTWFSQDGREVSTANGQKIKRLWKEID